MSRLNAAREQARESTKPRGEEAPSRESRRLSFDSRYLVLAEEHTRGIGWTGTLVGRAVNADVRRTAKYRTAVVIRTFADRLVDARHRYEEYLRIVNPAQRIAPAGPLKPRLCGSD